jgi:hypothetical protein
MGVLSIIVAALALLGGGIMELTALGQVSYARAMAMRSRMVLTSAARAQAAAKPVSVGPGGLRPEDRQTAVNIMTGLRQLNIPRQAQLDGLLAAGGRTILGIQPGNVTSSRVRAAIQSNSRGPSPRAGELGPDSFITESGTIELYDGNGIFRPRDHSPPIRVHADVAKYQQSLEDQDLQATTETFTYTAPAAGSSTTAPAAFPTGALPTTAPVGTLDGTAQTMVFTEAGLSALLAIYLLVVAIFTLRSHRFGGRLHLIYALLKLPLIALAFHGWQRFEESYSAVMSMTQWGGGTVGWFTNAPVVACILGAIYPIALLVMLRTKAVRDYYMKPAV